ncbi:TonB C-terminal domain-containing protein [candidate division WOR-3 bacterium]|nr:TonB C-terminal domain-containing protein [candidate division WOR-3 bacterium]
MNRFHIVSFVLHAILFVSLIITSQASPPPMPQFEVVKVSIAPLPQPKVVSVAEPVMPEIPEIVEKKSEDKAPPQVEKNKEKKESRNENPPQPKNEQNVKKGLPDIKPTIYTGSGRGFTYSYYLNILLTKIQKNWDNPFKGKDVVLKSIVYFEVDQKGTINNVRLEENSGNDLYNETTIRAITLTKKLPPLPQEFSDDYLKVHLEFLSAQ